MSENVSEPGVVAKAQRSEANLGRRNTRAPVSDGLLESPQIKEEGPKAGSGEVGNKIRRANGSRGAGLRGEVFKRERRLG